MGSFFFSRMASRELNLQQFKANDPGKSSFQEKKQKKVPWTVQYQNDGLSWISPPERAEASG
jgi:hypothetical protein